MIIHPRTPAERLRFAREKAGYRTAKDFAEKHDIPQATYAHHEKGSRRLLPDAAEKYAEELGCSAAWLLTGEGVEPPNPSEGIIPRNFAISELDIRASAGHGSVMERLDGGAEVTDVWEIPRDFLRAQTTATGDALRVIRVYGDSMEPVFRAGERVLVDTSDRRPSPPGIFVVWDGLGVVVKRLEFIPYSTPPAVRLMSANPAYGSYERPLGEIAISGRVIGKWQWT